MSEVFKGCRQDPPHSLTRTGPMSFVTSPRENLRRRQLLRRQAELMELRIRSGTAYAMRVVCRLYLDELQRIRMAP